MTGLERGGGDAAGIAPARPKGREPAAGAPASAPAGAAVRSPTAPTSEAPTQARANPAGGLPRRARLGAAGGAVGAGLLICASLPPWGWWPLAVAGLVCLDRLIADQPRAVRAERAALVGAGIFFPSLVWMEAFTLPGYLIAAGAYSLLLAGAVAAAPAGRGRWLALPGAWALAELLRWSWPFGGVPVSNLAIGQVAGPAAPVLALGGALLLVVLTVAAGMAAAAALRRQWRWAAPLAAGVAALVGAAHLAPQGHEIGRAEIALVQGGGPQGLRVSPATVLATFERHVEATRQVAPGAELVLWPEAAVDTEEPLVEHPWAGEIAAIARRLGAPLLVGAVEGAGPEHFRNASVLFDADGNPGPRYDKVHRVPFGEYVPLRSLLEPIAGNALPRRDAIPGDRPALLHTPIGPVALAISWEVFFSGRVREGVLAGGQVVLNQTNGASFTGTIVQSQQVASSRMRAIESGRWVLQVAPTGFSAVIDSTGAVLERSAVGEQLVIQREVGLREGQTLYTRLGLGPGVLLAALGVAGGWLVEHRSGRLARGRRAAGAGTPAFAE